MQEATRCGVEFVYAIAPGLDIRGDDDSELEALDAKREQLRSSSASVGTSYCSGTTTVNDFAAEMLFLGPLRGRDPKTAGGKCRGIVANGMLQAVPSKLALATVADWARDPAGSPDDVEPPSDVESLVEALLLGVDAATGSALLEPFV